jgi:DHA3 family macrolide efflux protein-like MFS transporter
MTSDLRPEAADGLTRLSGAGGSQVAARRAESPVRGLLSNRNFMSLFIGQTMSQAGDQFVLIAALYMINKMLNSQLAIAAIALSLSLPQLPLSLLAGVAVDRWNRKTTMIVTDLLRAGIVLLPLIIRRPGQIWILYLCGIALGASTTLFAPARNAVIPNIVPQAQLFLANGALQATFIVGTIAGAAGAGFAVDAYSPYYAFVFDSATFLFSAIAIAVMTVPHRQVNHAKATVAEIWRQLKEGVNFIRYNRILLRIMWITAIAALGLSALMILGVGYLEQELGVSASGFGVVVAAIGVGVGLGGWALRWLMHRLSLTTLVGGCLALVGVSVMSFSFLPSYGLVVMSAVLVGIGIVVARAGLATMTQKLTPDPIRGRVESAVNMIIGVSNVGSQGVSGVIGEFLSASIVFLGAGAITVVAGIATLWSLRGGDTE